MALPKNRPGVVAILKELEPRILGKPMGGMSCGCGAIHCGAGTVVEIDPGGDSYPGQEVMWYMWRAVIRTPEGQQWSIGLSEFVPSEELDAMFRKYFGKPKRGCPYHMKRSGEKRVWMRLPPAVRIKDNDMQTRFCFDWGTAQDVAEQLDELYKTSPRRMPGMSDEYAQIVALLETLQPKVYRGGPDPELPFESAWLMDYQAALKKAEMGSDHVFIQGVGQYADYRGCVYTESDVVFMKHAVVD